MSVAMYLVGLIISYVAAFIITNAAIRDEEVAQALGGIVPEAGEKGKGGNASNNNTEPAHGARRRVKHGEVLHLPRAHETGSATFEHVVHDPAGMHARPAGELAHAASDLEADIVVEHAGRTASAKSVVELMLLEAGAGDALTVRVTGPDAQKAAGALKRLMNEKL